MTRLFLCPATLDVRPAKRSAWDEGWGPAFSFELRGPIPSASQVIVSFCRPDGSDWLSVPFDTAECGEDGRTRVEGSAFEENLRTAETGSFPFSVRLVSELEGVDETLFSSTFAVEERPVSSGRMDYHSPCDWRLLHGSLWLDLGGDADAPVLVSALCLKNGAETWELEAYLFHNGKKVLSSETSGQIEISAARVFPAASGELDEVAVREFQFEFRAARGYIGAEYQDMDSWYDLSRNPGSYEIKVTRQKELVRILPFSVGEDGRIVPGELLAEKDGTVQLLFPVKIAGTFDGPVQADTSAAFYGHASWDSGLDPSSLYANRPEVSPEEPKGGLSEDVEALAKEVSDRASKLCRWYWADMENGDTSTGCLEASERVVELTGELAPLLEKLESVSSDSLNLELDGTSTALSEVRGKMQRLREMAGRWLRLSREESGATLEPYRQLLANDKLRILEEHPPADYRYYGSHKTVIESPEEFAAAAVWYFEGTASQGYLNERWTVKGWRFDGEGNIVERFDESGFGTQAPASAFR